MSSSHFSLASHLDNLLALKFTIVCLEAVCFSRETAKAVLSVLCCDKKRVSVRTYLCTACITCFGAES